MKRTHNIFRARAVSGATVWIGTALLALLVCGCSRPHQEFYRGYGLELPALFGPSEAVQVTFGEKVFEAVEFSSRVNPVSFWSYTPARLKILTMRFTGLDAERGVPGELIDNTLLPLLSPEDNRDVRDWSTGRVTIVEGPAEDVPVSPSESLKMKSVHYLFKKDPQTFYLLSGYAAVDGFDNLRSTFHKIARSFHYL